MRNEVLVSLEQKLFKHIANNPSLVFQFTGEDFPSESGRNILRILQKYGEREWSSEKIYYWLAEEGVELHREVVDEVFGQADLPSEDFEELRGILRREATKHRMKEVMSVTVARELDSKDTLDTSVVEKAIAELSKGLAFIENGGKYKMYSSEQLTEEYINIVNRRKIEKGFWDTGCSHLNSVLSEGFAPQKITSIYASSGIGKSSYALYLVNRQINCRIPSIYITLEMDMASTMDRLIGMRHKLPLRMFYRRNNEDMHENLQVIEGVIAKEKESLTKNPCFRLVDQPGLSMADIESIVEQAKREMGVNYLVCTIDLLSMVRDFNTGEGSTADRYEHAMNNLHEVARRTNCHFVGVFQSKRNSVPISKEDDIDKMRPKIENIKNSGAIEERSRIIISLFRKKFYMQRYFPGSPTLDSMPDLMEVKIDKQNMGTLGLINYWFEPEAAYMCKYEEVPAIKPFEDQPKADEGQVSLDTNPV